MNAPFTPSDDSAWQRENPGLPSMAERSAAMADVTARLDAHVPLTKPAQNADEAVMSLMSGLLSKDEMKIVVEGHKAFERGGWR